jgi:protein O-GlcNAc transferase
LKVRDLGAMRPDEAGDPAAWRRTADAIAAEDADLLVDLDDSLMPYSPGYVASRPARAQATWFNMTGPSGDPTYDAFVGPSSIYPADLAAAFPGRILGLPPDLYVYEPELWTDRGVRLPAPGSPPMLRNFHPTFGSLSHPYKIGDACLALWAKVLRAVPEARLHLGNNAVDDVGWTERVATTLARLGVSPDRLDFSYRYGWPNYLAGYSEIDVVLGTYPVAGGTTIFEAAHMGMPVLSRVGRTSLGRIGVWLAAATGRAGVAHADDDSFVAEAVRLARAPDELARLRAEEPARLRAKSRVDAARMADAFLDSIRHLL